MMECPKCGFSQPQDQFCANCGVDIARYSRTHRTSRFSLKPWVAGGLIALVAAVLAVVLLPPWGSPPLPELSFEEERIESFGRFNLGERRAPTSEQVATGEAEDFASQEGILPSDPLQEPEVAPARELSFSMVLVPSLTLAQWISEATEFTTQGAISSGRLAQEELRGLEQLPSVLRLNTPELIHDGSNFFASLPELGLESTGFRLEAQLEGSLLELIALSVIPEQRIEDGRTRWEESEVVQRWTFDLQSPETLFILGLLPRPPQVPRAAPWNLPGLFELWDMEDFVEGDRELVLIVEGHR